MSRPNWCSHSDCHCLSHRDVQCIGRLPFLADHGEHTKVNTHRWCLYRAADNGGVLDLQVNWGDLWQFAITFNAVARDEGRPPLGVEQQADNKQSTFASQIADLEERVSALEEPRLDMNTLIG